MAKEMALETMNTNGNVVDMMRAADGAAVEAEMQRPATGAEGGANIPSSSNAANMGWPGDTKEAAKDKDNADNDIPSIEKTSEAGQQETTENDYLIKFNKPYVWEGKEYTELDLSGLEKLTIRDAVDVQKKLFNDGEAATAMLCETTTAFSREIACRATGKPIEFFKFMPIRLANAIRTTVQAYLNTSGNEDGTVALILSKPYEYNGETYKIIPVDGLAELNSLNASAAENELTKEGFIITATTFNYLYACILLGMATNHPTEFYTGLPLKELLNVKNTANNSDFFE